MTTIGVNHLFHNESGVALVDVTEEVGLSTDVGHSVMAAWADYDEDGHLDLYVANHGLDTDRLFHATGLGTFHDVTASLPGASLHKPAFAATFTDIDYDGDLDLYVVNDHIKGNEMWRNDQGRWTNIGHRNGTAIKINGMGLAVGDYDNDLDLDFFMSDIYHGNLMQSLHSQGSAGHKHVGPQAGVDFAAISWGTDFVDFDNDGWLDIYLCTQHPTPAISNRLFQNNGNGTFHDVTALSGADNLGFTYGLATADYDEDGFIDFVIGNRGDGYVLYRNQGTVGVDHHWITIDLYGGGPIHGNAIGTRVYVTDTAGRKRMAEVRAGSTMGGGHSRRLHFGLGGASVHRVEIHWTDGTIEQVTAPTDTVWAHAYPT